MALIRRASRLLGTVLLFALVAACLALVIVPRFLDRIYYRGPVSGHYDGERFFNPDGEIVFRSTQSGRAGFFWRWITGADTRPEWPESVAVTRTRPPARVEGDAMRATWIGHATVLVQTQGLNILTDPIWNHHAGPFSRFGPKRVAPPGVAFDDLPKIDLVLISHNHYDHLDLPTLKRLWERDRPTIVTSPGNDSVIAQGGVEAVAIDWGGRLSLRPGIEVIVNRNHHWSSRWFTDRNRALWSSFVVTLPGGNLFVAGDTGMGDGRWPAEAASHGPVRLAIIPIGAFRFSPGEMGTGSHVGPIEAAEVFERLGAARGLPVHWGTFRLSYEAYDTPPKLLAEVMRCRGHEGRAPFAAVAIGEQVAIPAYASPAPPPSRGDVGQCIADSATAASLR